MINKWTGNNSLLFSQKEVKSIQQKNTIKLINPGAGTTGTTEVFTVVCNEMHLKSWHSPYQCGHRGFNSHVLAFDQALKRPGVSIKNSLKNRLRLFTSGFYITDDPVRGFFSELLVLSPQAGIAMTFREPTSWLHSRISHHPGVKICLPSLWDHPSVLHPYDISGCLSATGYRPAKAITNLGHYVTGQPTPFHLRRRRLEKGGPFQEKYWLQDRVQELVEAYIQANTMIIYLTLASGRPFLPICLWDMVPYNKNDLVDTIYSFLRNNSIEISPTDI
eukprot:CAMPEP_0185037650 /NCGR_PEP_ID=MMETSP1103-20130426/32373_1 /TAXON_ID=36769 /ORGANISM="Paraphysomonas bandaiensis, Strain Caron Lab Isolate" /LENGTH=275 /DNA_ID=CAMNT_0027575727 /DNA_START=154 /DNA_END=978 /DNA_ORIENTATION=-